MKKFTNSEFVKFIDQKKLFSRKNSIKRKNFTKNRINEKRNYYSNINKSNCNKK